MIDRFERFSFALSEIYRYWHKVASDEMEKYGLKGPYAVYFTTLYRHTDGITSARLCEICSRDKSDVSRAVAVLLKDGYIIKEGTNYRALLKLTQKGAELAEKINLKAKEAVEFCGKGLSETNREIFYNSLESIAENLHNLSKKGL